MNKSGVQGSHSYPKRLHHEIPNWVPNGELFHIRIRISPLQKIALTDETLGPRMIESVEFYHLQLRWHCLVCVFMPDHFHALLSFPAESRMSQVLGQWKNYHTRQQGILWQDNFFDHRLRNDAETREKYLYVLNNPVAKGLCSTAETWPWIWPKVERAVPAR